MSSTNLSKTLGFVRLDSLLGPHFDPKV